MPQVVRYMLPSLISQLVVLLKDSSLGFIVGYTIPFCGVALLPSALIALLVLALTRKSALAMRVWTFLSSILAIFFALGSFVVA